MLRSEKGGEVLASATIGLVDPGQGDAQAREAAELQDEFPLSRERMRFRRAGQSRSRDDPEQVFSGTIAFSDIDVNRHMNAGKYMQWFLDSYPEEFRLERTLKSIELNYIAEGGIGHDFQILREKDKPGVHDYLHSMIRAEDRKELCRARVVWE